MYKLFEKGEIMKRTKIFSNSALTRIILCISIFSFSLLWSYVISDDGVNVHGVNQYGNHYYLNRNTGTITYQNTPGGYHYNKYGATHTYEIPDYSSSESGYNNNNFNGINSNSNNVGIENNNNKNNFNSLPPYQNKKPEKEKRSGTALFVLEIVGLIIGYNALKSKNEGPPGGCMFLIGVAILVFWLIVF